jgi:hypothetical protein
MKMALKTFEAKIWEKAEHWYFEATVVAEDEVLAWRMFLKDYPPRSYTVSRMHQIPTRYGSY